MKFSSPRWLGFQSFKRFYFLPYLSKQTCDDMLEYTWTDLFFDWASGSSDGSSVTGGKHETL